MSNKKNTKKPISELKCDINVKDIDKDDYKYMSDSHIPITTFVRLAIKEKIARDK